MTSDGRREVEIRGTVGLLSLLLDTLPSLVEVGVALELTISLKSHGGVETVYRWRREDD